MKSHRIVGEIAQFRGAVQTDHPVVVEVTDVNDDGLVELRWDEGAVESYLRIRLGDVVLGATQLLKERCEYEKKRADTWTEEARRRGA